MSRGAWLFVLAFGCAAALPAPPRAVAPWSSVSAPFHRDEPTLDALLARVRTLRGTGKGPYAMPTADEERAARDFVAAVVSHAVAEGPLTIEALGARLRAIVAPPGHGLMLLRDTPLRKVVIEVPHSFADLHTLEIGVGLFHALGARALVVNGTQRFVGCAKPEVEGDTIDKARCPADVAHTAHSLFMGMHEALADDAGTLFIQMHGFQPTEGDPLVILSAAGTAASLEPVAGALRTRLAPLSPRPVATYPAEIGRLGGLTNVQARSLVARGGAMLHVELSRVLRERLRTDAAIRTAFADAFEAARVP